MDSTGSSVSSEHNDATQLLKNLLKINPGSASLSHSNSRDSTSTNHSNGGLGDITELSPCDCLFRDINI